MQAIIVQALLGHDQVVLIGRWSVDTSFHCSQMDSCYRV